MVSYVFCAQKCNDKLGSRMQWKDEREIPSCIKSSPQAAVTGSVLTWPKLLA